MILQKTKHGGMCKDEMIALFQYCPTKIQIQKSVNRLLIGSAVQFNYSLWLDKTKTEIPSNQYDNKVSGEDNNNELPMSRHSTRMTVRVIHTSKCI